MTRKINISGIIFHVEPLGYEILSAYMEAWNQGSPKRKALWEEQVAEYLLQKLKDGDKVTTADHVKELNKILKEVPFKKDKSRNNGLNHSHKKFNLGHYITQIAMGLW